MASDYSPWVWSPEHQRHYCWRHNEEGVIEYQWSGPPVQTQASNVPRTVPSSSQPEGGYSYSSTSAQTSAPSQVTQAHGEEDEVEDEEEEGAEDDEEDDEDDDDDGDDDDDDDDNGEGSAEGSQQPSQTALAQKSWPHRTPGYPQSTAHGAPITYNPNYRSVQQPAPSNTSPHYTYRQPSYPNSVQPAVSPPAQQGSQQKVRHIRTGADGKDNEALDPRYKRVSPRSCASFFCYGRVFMMLWTEPAGRVHPGRTRGSTHFSVVKYSETAYSEIRRFVVVFNKGSFSQCVPVQTYRRQGATKSGVVVKDHAVIYTGGEHDDPPSLLEGEGITKQALRVVADGDEALDVCSRINFGKTYTVEHNVKVLSIGTIAPEHRHLLENYWRSAHQ